MKGMRYRELGRSGIKVPVLGFGAMRFPMLPGKKDTKRKTGVNVPEATRMLHRAYELGVTYFDTAYGYHMGWSEVIVGKALKGLPRDRVTVTTKLPVWLAKQTKDFARLLRTQLRRLRTDHLDFYLLHALNKDSFERVRDLGVFDFLEQERERGRVRHIGFSYHDRAAHFAPILDAYDWDLCQVQYNIVDTDYQAGRKGVRYAARKGVGVVIMEPLRGGDLVNCIPPAGQRAWDSIRPKRPPVEWLLRWLWDEPGVSMVLSGMGSMEQLEQNVAVASKAKPRSLTPNQKRVINRVRAAYRRLQLVPCTNCGYCLPCPSGVNIPRNFAIRNSLAMFPDSSTARMEYNRWMAAEQRASACTDCGRCVPLCPQQIPIPERLKEVDRALANA